MSRSIFNSSSYTLNESVSSRVRKKKQPLRIYLTQFECHTLPTTEHIPVHTNNKLSNGEKEQKQNSPPPSEALHCHVESFVWRVRPFKLVKLILYSAVTLSQEREGWRSVCQKVPKADDSCLSLNSCRRLLVGWWKSKQFSFRFFLSQRRTPVHFRAGLPKSNYSNSRRSERTWGIKMSALKRGCFCFLLLANVREIAGLCRLRESSVSLNRIFTRLLQRRCANVFKVVDFVGRCANGSVKERFPLNKATW